MELPNNSKVNPYSTHIDGAIHFTNKSNHIKYGGQNV